MEDHLTCIETTIDSMSDAFGTAIHVDLPMVTIEEADWDRRAGAVS